MKYLARIFGKRIESRNEWCHLVAYFWCGQLYYWKRDYYSEPKVDSASAT